MVAIPTLSDIVNKHLVCHHSYCTAIIGLLVMVNRIVIAVIFSLSLWLVPISASAVTQQDRGLFVSPSRQGVKANVGGEATGKIIIYNYYTKPLHVDLAVKEFTAAGETYKYTFKQPIKNWITLSIPGDGIDLQKDQQTTIPFVVNVPKDATPGDHYFAIFVSADMSGKGFRQTAQVVSLVYVQAGGGKIIRSATIESANMHPVVFTPTLDYSFNVKNTGNVHFDAYFYARLENQLGKYPVVGANQVVLAKTTRRVTGDVPMPLLPGIYKMTYGYTNYERSPINTRSATIFYIPPWFIVAIVLTILVIVWVIQRRKKSESV